MKGKTTTKTTTTVIKNAKSKRRGTRNRRRPGRPPASYTGASGWLASLYAPFNSPATYIPDERTAFSGKVISKYATRGAITEISGTSTSHTFGFVIPPQLGAGLFGINLTAAGGSNLTDLNAAGTAYYNQIQWTNLNSIVGGSSATCRSRVTALGIRAVYEGTELQRAGKFVAGLVPIATAASGVAATGTKLSPLSTLGAGVTPLLSDIYNSLEFKSECRVSDGVFEYTWIPNGIPAFQLAPGTGFSNALPSTTTAGAAVVPSFWNGPAGQACVEGGQYMLVFWVEGDTTSAASSSSNVYSFEFVLHTENVPENLYTVAYELTPSPFDVSDLQQCLNEMEVLPHSHNYSTGTTMNYSLGATPGNDVLAGAFDVAGKLIKHPLTGRLINAAGQAGVEMLMRNMPTYAPGMGIGAPTRVPESRRLRWDL